MFSIYRVSYSAFCRKSPPESGPTHLSLVKDLCLVQTKTKLRLRVIGLVPTCVSFQCRSKSQTTSSEIPGCKRRSRSLYWNQRDLHYILVLRKSHGKDFNYSTSVRSETGVRPTTNLKGSSSTLGSSDIPVCPSEGTLTLKRNRDSFQTEYVSSQEVTVVNRRDRLKLRDQESWSPFSNSQPRCVSSQVYGQDGR